jgi:DNA topoisomerase-1
MKKEAKNIVIVESPAKAKTIERYLGKDYEVIASKGHIRDLPAKKFGIDIEKNFKPEFETMKGKEKVIKDIKAKVKDKHILLAPDMDREGEAIAWHLAKILKIPAKEKVRIIFSEITKNAITESINNPLTIDNNKVDAQLARRLLDRIVGYKISPLVWRVFKNYKTSAGRVQSAALRILVEKERNVFKFKPTKYFKIYIQDKNIQIPLNKENGKKLKPETVDKKKKDEILDYLKDKHISVSNTKEKQTQKSTPDPFITSSLQQSGVSILGWSSKKTMKISQELYEGIKTIDGQIAFITYMRTDSKRISETAQESAKKYLLNTCGKEYCGNYKTSKNKAKIQDAHEAIRPTNIDIDPQKASQLIEGDQLKLYNIIWNRFMASQSVNSKYNEILYTISDETKKYDFEITSKERIFDGFEKFWTYSEKENNFTLDKESKYSIKDIKADEKETQPPPRYSEATLIKELEKNGIGRPSTYSTIISTLLDREYVIKINKNVLKPTIAGFVVTDFLEKTFPEIIDSKFTALMEENLDEIETGDKKSTKILKEFYTDFEPLLITTDKKLKEKSLELDYVSDIPCSKCEKNMKLNFGRYGMYLSCEECKETRKVPFITEGVTIKNNLYVKDFLTSEIEIQNVEIGEKCPECGSELVHKKGRYGDFIACSNYPACKYTKNIPCRGKCPKCSSEVTKLKSKKGKIYFKCTNKECGEMFWNEPSNYKCPECEDILYYKNSKNGEILYCEKNKTSYKLEEFEQK